MISSFPQHWHWGQEDSVMQGSPLPLGISYLSLNAHLTPRTLHITSSFWKICLCVCAHMHTHMITCHQCRHVHVMLHCNGQLVKKKKKRTSYVSPTLPFTLRRLRRPSSFSWSPLSLLTAGGPGLRMHASAIGFCGFWWPNLRSSCLYDKPFTHWAIHSLAQPHTFSSALGEWHCVSSYIDAGLFKPEMVFSLC